MQHIKRVGLVCLFVIVGSLKAVKIEEESLTEEKKDYGSSQKTNNKLEENLHRYIKIHEKIEEKERLEQLERKKKEEEEDFEKERKNKKFHTFMIELLNDYANEKNSSFDPINIEQEFSIDEKDELFIFVKAFRKYSDVDTNLLDQAAGKVIQRVEQSRLESLREYKWKEDKDFAPFVRNLLSSFASKYGETLEKGSFYLNTTEDERLILLKAYKKFKNVDKDLLDKTCKDLLDKAKVSLNEEKIKQENESLLKQQEQERITKEFVCGIFTCLYP